MGFLQSIKEDPAKIGGGLLIFSIVILTVLNAFGVFKTKTPVSTLAFIFIFYVVAVVILRLLSGARRDVKFDFEDFMISLIILAIIFGLVKFGILPVSGFSTLPLLGGP